MAPGAIGRVGVDDRVVYNDARAHLHIALTAQHHHMRLTRGKGRRRVPGHGQVAHVQPAAFNGRVERLRSVAPRVGAMAHGAVYQTRPAKDQHVSGLCSYNGSVQTRQRAGRQYLLPIWHC